MRENQNDSSIATKSLQRVNGDTVHAQTSERRHREIERDKCTDKKHSQRGLKKEQ